MGALAIYYGGRVLSNAAIATVFWTAGVDVDIQQQVGAFYAAIASSSYVDWLEEYDTLGLAGALGQGGSRQHIGRGRYLGAFTIAPSTQSPTLDDAQIAAELTAQIAAGHLPLPTLDATGSVDTLYMIELPPGTAVTFAGGQSCVDFCAYHSTAVIDGRSVPYAVLPDSHSCVGLTCGQGFDDETILRSHELGEAITDTESGLAVPGVSAFPMAWAGDAGARSEIGDVCFHGFEGDHDEVAGYAVQKLWSNFAGACVVGVPVCAGAALPPACRPCSALDDGAACDGATPVCDATTRQCRACQGSECAARVDAGAGADAGADGSVLQSPDAGGDATTHPDVAARAAGCNSASEPGGPASTAAGPWLLLASASALSLSLARRRRRQRSIGSPEASQPRSPPSRNATGTP